MTEEEMVRVVNSYIDALNQRDLSVIGEIYEADATVEDPVGSDPRSGWPALREFYSNAFQIDLEAGLTGAVRCAGKSVAFPFHLTFAIGDSKTRIDVIDVFEFSDNGNVRTMKAYWGPANTHSL